MQRLDQTGRLFLPVFYHLVHSIMQCLLTSSPFALVYLQNSPKSSCGMEHPQTNSWTVSGRKKNHCSNNQFCKIFALCWSPDIVFVPEPLTLSQLIPLLHPFQPTGNTGTVCCSEQYRTCYTSSALFILAT